MKIDAKFLFPEIKIIECEDPNRVLLDLGPATVLYERNPQTGALTRGKPVVDPFHATSDFGCLEGHIGKQWPTRADPIAKQYFGERPSRFHQAAE